MTVAPLPPQTDGSTTAGGQQQQHQQEVSLTIKQQKFSSEGFASTGRWVLIVGGWWAGWLAGLGGRMGERQHTQQATHAVLATCVGLLVQLTVALCMSSQPSLSVGTLAMLLVTAPLHPSHPLFCLVPSVWDSSIVVTKYLEKLGPDWLRGKRLLDLSAGCGLVGTWVEVDGVLGYQAASV